jgi:hypothetical protein
MPFIPPYQGGGPEKNEREKWRAKEEERHKGLLTHTHTPLQKKLNIILGKISNYFN